MRTLLDAFPFKFDVYARMRWMWYDGMETEHQKREKSVLVVDFYGEERVFVRCDNVKFDINTLTGLLPSPFLKIDVKLNGDLHGLTQTSREKKLESEMSIFCLYTHTPKW